MAIIAGQAPPPDPRFEKAPRRVVVKLKPEAATVQPPAIAADTVAPMLGDDWKLLSERHPGLSVRPYFTTVDERSLDVGAGPVPPSFAGTAGGTRYLAIDVPSDVEPDEVTEAVRHSSHVEIAYAEGGPTPPPVNPSDDPRSGDQGYLDAAPQGIDARWAWDFGAADGSSVGFVDLEQGWTLDHEDLAAAGIGILSGQNHAYPGHGTAVLGQVVAVDNDRGCVGIAPGAAARVVSQWRPDFTYNTADAILAATADMRPGDVLLLEAQTRYVTVAGFVPVEVEEAVFDAIRLATTRGIVVIEAAGNGGVDLDEFEDVQRRRILNRNSPDFRDSGAILVGAASADPAHRRLDFSNFGSRVDCFAWGERVETCGDGWTGTATDLYTSNFGGTSGASPIVTGGAVLLQAWRARTGLPLYDPGALRQILSAVSGNTPSFDPVADRMGVMPDLRAIIERERVQPTPSRLVA